MNISSLHIHTVRKIAVQRICINGAWQLASTLLLGSERVVVPLLKQRKEIRSGMLRRR